ncbi:MAG: hypothetical protein ACR2JF_11930 [Iamia sp.]
MPASHRSLPPWSRASSPSGEEVPGTEHGGLAAAANADGDGVLSWMLERVRPPS